MKWSPLLLAALTPFAFLSSGAFVGHVAVLVVTLAIFFGTLSLGRIHRSTTSTPPQIDRTLSS